MKRRTVIAGLGSLTVSGALAVGSGAFTSVSAERTLAVETAGDNQSLLRLKQLGDGKRSIESGSPEEVEFSFPGLQERLDDSDLGLGTDSVYEFDRDASASQNDDPTEGLLRITNQGTQTIHVYSQHETESEIEIELYDVDDSNETALRVDPKKLATGKHVDVGFRIRTFGAQLETFDETLTIIGEVPDS